MNKSDGGDITVLVMSSETCSQTNSCGNEDLDYDFDYSTHYTTRPKGVLSHGPGYTREISRISAARNKVNSWFLIATNCTRMRSI